MLVLLSVLIWGFFVSWCSGEAGASWQEPQWSASRREIPGCSCCSAQLGFFLGWFFELNSVCFVWPAEFFLGGFFAGSRRGLPGAEWSSSEEGLRWLWQDQYFQVAKRTHLRWLIDRLFAACGNSRFRLTSALFCFVCFFRENMLDGTVVFTLLFGSELFEDYIGHLAMATMASSEMASDNDNPEKLQDRLKVSELNSHCSHLWLWMLQSQFDFSLLSDGMLALD